MACVSVVIMTGLFITAAIYLKVRVDSTQSGIAQINSDLSALIRESREFVQEMRQIAGGVSRSTQDVQHMMHTAREWTDRADRLVDAVGAIAEPPLLLISKKVRIVGAIVNGVLQVLLAPKR